MWIEQHKTCTARCIFETIFKLTFLELRPVIIFSFLTVDYFDHAQHDAHSGSVQFHGEVKTFPCQLQEGNAKMKKEWQAEMKK